MVSRDGLFVGCVHDQMLFPEWFEVEEDAPSADLTTESNPDANRTCLLHTINGNQV